MTDISEKALDELDQYINRRLVALADEMEDVFDPSDTAAEMAEWQGRLDALTTLRARVRELEEAPEAEGRECGCPKVQAHGKGNVWWFACKQAGSALVATRCTVAEGGEDD